MKTTTLLLLLFVISFGVYGQTITQTQKKSYIDSVQILYNTANKLLHISQEREAIRVLEDAKEYMGRRNDTVGIIISEFIIQHHRITKGLPNAFDINEALIYQTRKYLRKKELDQGLRAHRLLGLLYHNQSILLFKNYLYQKADAIIDSSIRYRWLYNCTNDSSWINYDSIGLSKNLIIRGQMRSWQNKNQQAYEYFNQARNILKQHGHQESLELLVGLMSAQNKMGNIKQAWKISQEAKTKAKDNIIAQREIYQAQRQLIEPYHLKGTKPSWVDIPGNINQIYQELTKQYEMFNDSIVEKSKINAINDVRAELAQKESQLKEQENKELQLEIDVKELANQRLWWGLGGLGILIIGAIIAIVLVMRQKREKELLLSEKERLVIELENAKLQIEMTHRETRKSIAAQAHVQQKMMPPIPESIPHSLLYKPKSPDGVSGDFWWHHETQDTHFILIGDCTGHGPEGSMVALIMIKMINDIVKKNIYDPGEILTLTDKDISGTFHPGQEEGLFNGMDCSLIAINKTNGSITYAGAKNSPILITKDGTIIKLDVTRMGIGGIAPDEGKIFVTRKIPAGYEGSLCLYSDGYVDQDNKDGVKIMNKRFQNTLKDATTRPINEQSRFLEEEFEKWKSNVSQRDDLIILIIEIKT